MKKVLSCILIVSMVLMVGCSKTQLTQTDLTMSEKQAEATKACHEARKIDFTGVDKEAVPYILMSRQFSDALLAVTGNEPCKTTNAFDVQIAEVNAKNGALEKGLGVAGNVGMFFIGADVLKTGFEAAGDTFSASDQGSVGVSQTNTNTANSESFNTATSTDDSHNTVDTTSNADSNNSTNNPVE